MKPIKLIIFAILSIFVGYFFLFKFEKGEEAVQTAQNFILSAASTNEENFTTPKPDEDNLPEHEITVSAWIPYWDESRGFQTFSDNADQIESVSPVWFYVNADGTLTQRKSDVSITTYVKQVHDKEGKVIPTITNASSLEFSNIINNPTLLEKHVNEIEKAAKRFNFDGIDIDYENLEGKDKDAFSNFISKLGDLLHRDNKLLTIAVLPKTDNIIYQFSSSRQAQDWEEIGKYVDEFRIMGYDWTHNSTTEHGAISPIYWLEEILEYSLTIVPKEKVVLALPLYGYYWKTGGVEALTWEQTDALKNSGTYEWDDSAKENHVIVGNANAWYHDARSIEERKKLAEEYKIKGVVYWRLGGEDPDIWK